MVLATRSIAVKDITYIGYTITLFLTVKLLYYLKLNINTIFLN